MSRGPETTFINAVHRHLREEVYRMKNHNAYTGGIADCWYSAKKSDLWVEYKYLEIPKRDDTIIDLMDIKKPYALSALQQQWLRDRYNEGRPVAVIVGSKNGGYILTNLNWEIQFSALHMKRELIDRKTIANWIANETM